MQSVEENGTTPVGGVCVTLTGPASYSVCDDQTGDADPSPGNIEIDGVVAGNYTFTLKRPPAFQPVGDVPQTVSVTAGQFTTLALTFRAIPPDVLTAVASPATQATGVVVFGIAVADGSPPPSGVCVQLTGSADYQACDDQDGDADLTPGSIEIDGVALGTYTLTVTAPAGYEAVAPPPTVEVPSTDLVSVPLTLRVAGSPVPSPEATPAEAAGGFVIILGYEDDGTTPRGGFCVALSGPATYTVCDDQAGDADLTTGSIELDNVPAGKYALTVTPPDGYETVESPASVEAKSGDLTQIAVRMRPAATPAVGTPAPAETASPEPAAGFVVFQILDDVSGEALGGACVDLTGQATYSVCDDQDGDADPTPGSIEIDNVPAGDYALTITPPDGYDAVEPPAKVQVPAGDVTQVPLAFRAAATPPAGTPVSTAAATPEQPATGFVVLQVFAQDGTTPLDGACLDLAGPATYSACDGQDGDADPTPGSIEIDNVVAGDYDVAIKAPVDYEPAGELPTTLHVDPGAPASLTATFRPVATPQPTEAATEAPTETPTEEATPPPASGSLAITKVDAADQTKTLPGACFAITATADGTSFEACDDDNDGVTRFEGLVPGDWSIHETQAPAGYAAGPDQTVTVAEGAEAAATVTDEVLPPQTGTLAAIAVDADDKPLAGACYAATGPDGAAVDGCDDDGDGRADLGAVAVGDWQVRQTAPPPAHDSADPPEQTVTVATDQPGEARFVNAATPTDRVKFPPALPKPTSVTVVGDFQDELGCPQDNDPTCPTTALKENHGVWTGVFAMSPGAHTFRIVAKSDVERSLGQGGDPNGADLTVTVPAEATGVYVEYDSATGRIIAAPRATLAQVVTDAGAVDLRPIEHGQFEGYFDAPAGTVNYQILLNGQSVTQDQIELDQESRIHTVVGADGTVVTIETVTPASLAVTRTDAGGTAVPGSCFAAVDGNGALAGQACDADDGATDGITTIAFPNGIREGTFTLKETVAPAGATPAPDQTVDLHAGDNQAQVAV
ncbi:MAG TPA: SpaA isopeptide-forming pilin-related protein [Thermomicrobiales bacterium]